MKASGVLPGTLVMMAHRSPKLCHDVVAGDVVLGADGLARVVEQVLETQFAGDNVVLVCKGEEPRLVLHPATMLLLGMPGLTMMSAWLPAEQLHPGNLVCCYFGEAGSMTGPKYQWLELERVERRQTRSPLHSFVLASGDPQAYLANWFMVKGGPWL